MLGRFYTYISSMHYVMEDEQGVRFLVLDRPHPNGHYIDVPIPDEDYVVRRYAPVPVVHAGRWKYVHDQRRLVYRRDKMS